MCKWWQISGYFLACQVVFLPYFGPEIPRSGHSVRLVLTNLYQPRLTKTGGCAECHLHCPRPRPTFHSVATATDKQRVAGCDPHRKHQMTTSLFTIGRNDKSEWTVTNTESGIELGAFWFREEAEQLVSKVEALIAAKREGDQSLYL